ncbi:hypothetical protein EJ04DRAFT_524237 [Polyplosphaeria fusca]|uniref:Uncharacterized protein n=1 Tax=Polyplosphaeria fusca TaxID=682080 RepID=A0A9P4QYV3_9PLEO|nr:hypothetical protein EJ04DRAFT_524237 [Polyplosphaeria fusca]
MATAATTTTKHVLCGIIDERLPYRIGCPVLPVLPVESTPAFTPVIQDKFSFYIQVQTILRKLIRPKIHGFLHRFSHNTSPTGTLTFLVTATYGPGSQAKWRTCVLKLRRLIINETKTQVAVEIIDTAVAFRYPPPKVILNQENVIIAASKLLPKVIDMICQYQWISIDVLCWYLPGVIPSYQPAIVICARDALDTMWWSNTLPKIRKLLYEAGGHLKVVLLFLDTLSLMICEPPDTDKPNTWPEPDTFIAQGMYEPNEPNMGTSCGREGSKHSGTLGGAVQLKKNGKTYNLGLTNCHVLLDDTDINLKKRLPPSPHLRRMKVMSPSDEDHSFVWKQRRAKLREVHRDHLQYSREWGEIPERQGIIDDLRGYEDSAWQSLAKAKDFRDKREIGTIYAVSGYKTCALEGITDDYALDWGLIELNSHSKICNIVPDFSGDRTVPPGTQINTWTPIGIKSQYRVAKRGRTSLWTTGKINTLPSTLNCFYLGPENPTNMAQDTIKNIPFDKERVVTYCIIEDKEKKEKEFLKSGDSGSLALLAPLNDSDPGPPGAIVGLCFASNLSTGAAYMTSMEMVVKNIEDVTGGTVTMPRRLE